MKALYASVTLALLGSCSTTDGVGGGARAECAHGGALVECAPAERTPEGACWRLVDCGAINVKNDKDDNAFDWGVCVDYIAGQSTAGEALIINCIAASSCDQLQDVGNRFDVRQPCLLLGSGK